MPAGTIALTNNSATVGGTGTAFTTELKAGDFIGVTVGGSPYTMIVASIASNTQLTIAQAYNGPTASGLAWYAVPASLMHAITQQTLNDMASNLRGMTLQMDNWQKIYSDAASVTVQRPDRSTFTGPSWGYMAAQYTNKASLVNGTVPISQGGTGGNTQPSARSGLGLGAAATLDAGDAQGQVLVNRVGIRSGGYVIPRTNGEVAPGLDLSGAIWDGWLSGVANGASNGGAPTSTINGTGYSYILSCTYTTANRTLLCVPYGTAGNSGSLAWRSVFGNGWTPWVNTRDTRNTTVDANGFIKQASPIMRLSDNPDEMDTDFTDGFTISGVAAVNFEALGAKAQKVGTGQYRITGSLGFAKEGWTIEIPHDINKNLLCFVEAIESDSGAIIINVFKRKFDSDTAMIVAGDAMDIPSGRWIDLRLQMQDDMQMETTS